MGTWLGPGLCYLDYGPIQMTLSAFREGQPLGQEITAAVEYAKDLLAELAPHLNVAKLSPPMIKQSQVSSKVLSMMVEAVRRCPDPSLTPMAAVAGSIADLVADLLVAKGATKVVINNGGDIALRLTGGESVKVGIASDLKEWAVSHMIEIDYLSQIKGIATSGLGGRGLTKGIASAVVILGENASQADACATLIANNTFSLDPEIKQVRAEELDPNTDLYGHLVTSEVGQLQPATRRRALSKGLCKASELVDLGLIKGAIIFVGKLLATVPKDLQPRVLPVRRNNNK